MEQTLLLLDIDGTLLRGAADAQIRALHEALGDVYGINGTETVEVRTSGRTDLEIARILAKGVGVKNDQFDSGREQLADRWVELHDQYCIEDLSDRVLAGVVETLQELQNDQRFKLSLVTGNLEPIAWKKFEAAGIEQFFQRGQGGFGSDHEVRDHLPKIARERAGTPQRPWPRERAVVVGDTPRDIACARADQLRVVAVATGVYGADQLIEADEVISEFGQLANALY